ncbi:MAG: DUF3500 domain-containing protein [Planctomycetota bacterium]
MASLRLLAWACVGGTALLTLPRGDSATAAMAQAARAFLASLPAGLRSQAMRPLGDAERTSWAFVPGDYPGVPFARLDATQRAAVDALLHSALSVRGHEKVNGIVELENVLRALESRDGRIATHRDPGRYAVMVFGDPTDDGTWSWRLQGHHLSLRFAIVAGVLASATPTFLGSNPHEVRQGQDAGHRVLGAEEDLARALLLLCDDAQRARAVLAAQAPADIVLGPTRAADFLGDPKGLPWSAMSAGQRELLWRLVEEFAHNLRAEFAQAELARIESQGRDAICFAWCGGSEHGQGHYFRIHGPRFVIEYDNTQNGANHVHTVWRDLDRDFGGDALLQHLRAHQPERGKPPR